MRRFSVVLAGPDQLPIHIPEQSRVRVLGTAERELSANVITTVGRRLIATVSAHPEPDSCVRIECDEGFVLGETIGRWDESGCKHIAVDLQHFVRVAKAHKSAPVPSWYESHDELLVAAMA